MGSRGQDKLLATNEDEIGKQMLQPGTLYHETPGIPEASVLTNKEMSPTKNNFRLYVIKE